MSVLASISNCGQSTVTLDAKRPGVTAGVARVTFTVSKMGFLKVRRYCVGVSDFKSDADGWGSISIDALDEAEGSCAGTGGLSGLMEIEGM